MPKPRRGSNGSSKTSRPLRAGPRRAETDSPGRPDLPAAPGAFWKAGADFASLRTLPPNAEPPALKQLGPLPFPRGSFPIMGFLATLGEHVAARAAEALAAGQGAGHSAGHG